MTSKERILAALNFSQTDRLPYSPLADNYFAASLPAQGHEYDLIKSLRYIGCDVIERHSPCYEERHGGGVVVSTKEVGKEYETTYETPVGSIHNRFYFENGAMYTRKHLLDSVEDVKVMTYVAEHTDFVPRFDLFEERKQVIGEDGIPTPTAPCSPLMETLQVLCGLENSTYILLDEPEAMEGLFAALHERNKKVYRLLCDIDSPVVFCYEDTSTTIMSRDWLTAYALPALNEYAEILHAGGKKYITHMCGKLSGFKTEIAGVKSDGIDSVCPPTTGDLALADARTAFPNKVLIGGIEPPSLVLKSREEILRGVAETVNCVTDKRGVILSTGDAVPHGSPIETLKAIADFLKYLGPRSLSGGVDPDEIKKFL